MPGIGLAFLRDTVNVSLWDVLPMLCLTRQSSTKSLRSPCSNHGGEIKRSQKRFALKLTLRAIPFTSMALCFCAASTAFGWGQDGHRLINKAAADLMETGAADFFRENAEGLALTATTPDVKWKDRATHAAEAPTHFFQWDVYKNSILSQTIDRVVLSQAMSSLGGEFVKKNGSAVWRVDQIFRRLVNALKSQKWGTALQMAGVMGHYVGDLSQPMHDTKDYDGQSIGRRGIHRYFETTLVDKTDQTALHSSVVDAGGPMRQELDGAAFRSADQGSKVVRMLSVREGKAGFGELDEILDHFRGDEPNDSALMDFFAPRMGSGAATLARIWDMAVQESGTSDWPTSKIDIDHPQWFPVEDPQP